MGVINIIDKLWKYLSGYAIISIEGFNKMKLINKAVKKFIKFSDITSNRVKATAIIPIEDLKKLYELNKRREGFFFIFFYFFKTEWGGGEIKKK